MNLRYIVFWYLYAPTVWSYIGVKSPGDQECIGGGRFVSLILT